MYLPKIHFLGGIFMVGPTGPTRLGREHATPPTKAARWSLLHFNLLAATADPAQDV